MTCKLSSTIFQRNHIASLYILSLSPSVPYLVTFALLAALTLPYCRSPSLSLSSPETCLTDVGLSLTASHSSNHMSPSVFLPVHHCLLPHLCIKYQALWKQRVAECHAGVWVHLVVLKGISPRLMTLLALSLCKMEQLVKQGEAVMEEVLIFPWCKSTMGVFEYCIKACWLWHTHT